MKGKAASLFRIVGIGMVCLIFFLFGVYIGKTRSLAVIGKTKAAVTSFFYKDYVWAIGIYTGDSPFTLASPSPVQNPVLTAKDVSDVEADFVADPFMIQKDSVWYMFFEVLNKKNNQGDIGLATSDDGLKWTYRQIVLDEPFHLSYPFVFEWRNEYYMIPESTEAGNIRLYKAIEFPVRWTVVKTLMEGDYADGSVVYFNDMWWMFAETNPEGHDTLCLYYADDPAGPWVGHPKNPVITGDANIARPGGRPLIIDGRLIRFAQDDCPTYGTEVRALEIEELTTETYREKEVPFNPILKATGRGWNKKGMHHVDAHRLDDGKWIACVDGFTDVFSPGIKD